MIGTLLLRTGLLVSMRELLGMNGRHPIIAAPSVTLWSQLAAHPRHYLAADNETDRIIE
jgi:hypothetical protein